MCPYKCLLFIVPLKLYLFVELIEVESTARFSDLYLNIYEKRNDGGKEDAHSLNITSVQTTDGSVHEIISQIEMTSSFIRYLPFTALFYHFDVIKSTIYCKGQSSTRAITSM